MKEKTLWHPATEFPESGAYVLVVYKGCICEQTIQLLAVVPGIAEPADHSVIVCRFQKAVTSNDGCMSP